VHEHDKPRQARRGDPEGDRATSRNRHEPELSCRGNYAARQAVIQWNFASGG
jgi:hypothetical protein